MIAEKMIKLARALRARTELGKVEWEPASRDETFVASLSGHSVGIRKERDDYYLDLIGDDGTLLESTSDGELSAQSPGANAYELLSALHQLARRRALGVEDALDRLLDEMGDG